jgi:LysM repeat protein
VLRWNTLDSASTLFEGMTLQLFVTHAAAALTALREHDVHVVAVGSEEFYALTDPKGRSRVRVVARNGDTLASVAQQYKVSPALLERINRRPRAEALSEGTAVYVYLDPPGAAH